MAGGRSEGFPSHIVYVQNLSHKKKKRKLFVGTYGRNIHLYNVYTGKKVVISIPWNKEECVSAEQKACLRKHIGDELSIFDSLYTIRSIKYNGSRPKESKKG